MGKALERGLEENNLNQRPLPVPGRKSPKDDKDKDDGSVYSDIEEEEEGSKLILNFELELFFLSLHFFFLILYYYNFFIIKKE